MSNKIKNAIEKAISIDTWCVIDSPTFVVSWNATWNVPDNATGNITCDTIRNAIKQVLEHVE